MTNHPTSCVSRAQPGLNKLILGATAALALLGSAPASASLVNFDSPALAGGLYVDGDTLDQNGYTLQATDSHGGTSGAVGLIANGSDPTTCWLGGCPTNNTSQFYLGLNDGGVTVTRSSGLNFSLRGLNYGFVAPTGGLPNFSYGQLQLTGYLANGFVLDLALNFAGTDSSGNPLFDKAVLTDTFRQAELKSLTIRACVFDDNGGCNVAKDNSDPTLYQAQFAIDNLSLAEVPEPGSLALIGLGMGALLARRRKSVSSHNA
jgi:hypothetical protein